MSAEAGRAALASGAWVDARAHFETALAEREDAAVLEALGWAGWWLADEALTLRARQHAYRLFRAAGDRAAAGRVATWLAADFREFRGDDAIGRGWLKRAHRLLDGLPETAEHGWLALTDADFALNVDRDLDSVLERARYAGDLGRRLGISDLEAVGLALEGLALVGTGAVETGMRALDEASAIAAGEDLRLPLSAGWALCCGLSACDGIGDFPRARQWCEAVRRIAERWGGRQLLGVCRTSYGRILASSGDWPAAEDELVAAVRDLEQARPGMAAPGLVRLGELRARQGRADEARALFERAGPRGVVGLGELALADGDAEGAAAAAERALRRTPGTASFERLPALELLARARLELGDLEGAESPCAAVADIAAACGTPFVRGRARLLAAQLGRDPEAACQAAEDAVDCFDEAAAPYDAALARVELAGALRALGRVPAADHELERAGRTFDTLGVRRSALPLPAANLTPREVEVLRLVARGLNDAEIAARLVLSPHTVHRHVANVRVKLRLPSRAAAVAYAARAGVL
jgi:DNA-binding CsgD family transcriptional regulator